MKKLFRLVKGKDAVPEFEKAKMVTYEELKLLTDDHCEKNLIGRCQHGLVYRGRIPQGWRGYDAKDVTVKMYSTEHVTPSGRTVHKVDRERLIDMMKDEIKFVSRPFLENHKIVGKVIGYCFDLNNLGIIFDLVPHYSLENIISDKDIFGWRKRVKVALALVRFLNLCHSKKKKYLVRNLSAGNIVVDQDFNPAIVDFTMIQGKNLGDDRYYFGAPIVTYGYVDSNTLMTGEWTAKSDIYMFGILLLELLMKHTSYELTRMLNCSDKLFIDDHVRAMYRAKLSKAKNGEVTCLFVNRHLQDDPDFDRDDGIELTKVGMSCIDPYPHKRPDMMEIVTKLEKLHVVTKHPDLSLL